MEQVLLGEGRTTEELLSTMSAGEMETHSKGPGSVTRHRPAPAAVQRSDTLLGHDLEEATALECLGVGLHLDLENIEGQEDDLTDTSQTAVSQAPRPTPTSQRSRA